MQDVVFDVANRSDIDELVRLRIAYILEDFGPISEEEKKNMEDRLPEYFERRLGKEIMAFVARAEGRLVAAVLLLIVEKPMNPSIPNGLCGDVLSVYTEETYRGRGICSTLMKNMVDYAKKEGLSRITLSATKDGYPVYKKAGFTDRVSKYTEMILNLREQ
ncbi:MAG: GNAT family N-acetyltransferase [Clostridiales bacterium]|nr:GNAT family N-acetyltransferase [Clostridiales bacterium]